MSNYGGKIGEDVGFWKRILYGWGFVWEEMIKKNKDLLKGYIYEILREIT